MPNYYIPMGFWIEYGRRVVATLAKQLEDTPAKDTYLRLERQRYLSFRRQELALLEQFDPAAPSCSPALP